MKKDKNDAPVAGIFLFSKRIKNDGKIIATGERPVTHIQTEQYSGKGSVESHKTEMVINIKWYEKWWVKYCLLPLIVLVTGAFVVFKLGWN